MTSKTEVNVSEEEIKKVLAKTNRKLKSYELFDNGYVNPIYFVKTSGGEDLVLRITNPLKRWRRNKTLNEVTIMTFLREKTTIPLPNIYDYSVDKETIDYEYILMEKIEGEPLSHLYFSASDEVKIKYIAQIAEYISQFKQFKFDKIGSFKENMEIGVIADIAEGPFYNFKEYISALLNHRIEHVSRQERFKKYVPLFKEFDEKVISTIDEDVDIVLSHHDLHFKNWMAKDGEIKALIDFEWSGAFPYCDDIINFDWDYEFDEFPKTKKIFYDILAKNNVKTEMSEKVKDVVETEAYAMSLAFYHTWFPTKKEQEEFLKPLVPALERIFQKYNIR